MKTSIQKLSIYVSTYIDVFLISVAICNDLKFVNIIIIYSVSKKIETKLRLRVTKDK